MVGITAWSWNKNKSNLNLTNICPEITEPYLAANYATKGTLETDPSTGFSYYSVGALSTQDSKAIIMISDIFGWNSGRLRAIADMFSEKTNSLVVIPMLL